MAIRPDNHITGDKAVRTISNNLIPEEWTISTPESDYGLDMLIEVVHNNQTTGRLFFIQSKGTMESSENGYITYSMDVSRIEDYSKMELPVLFVYYSKKDNKFWGRWMNSLYKTLSDDQKKQQTVTLKFFPYNEIDTDYLRSIGNRIERSITDCVSISCKDIPANFRRFHIQAINIAQQYIGPEIIDDVRLSCKTIFISYEGTLQNGCAILNYCNECIRIPIAIKSLDFLYYTKVEIAECPDCLLDLIYAIAIYGSQISHQSQDYILSYPSSNGFDYISLQMWVSFIDRLSMAKIIKLPKLFNIAVQYHHHDIAQYLLFVIFRSKSGNDQYDKLYNDLLSNYLASDIDDSFKGRLFYNLANSVRDVNAYESFSYYMKAVKYEHTYKNLYYWWQEVAGVFYITKHFKIAEQFYKKARMLSPEKCRNDIEILISDCLICQGRIDDALEEELLYVGKRKIITGAINLKMLITKIIAKQQINVFNPVYWFNQGIEACNNNKFSESLECFLFSWRLYDGDIEALTNAFIQALNADDVAKQLVIIHAIREISPDESYKHLVSTLLSNGVEDIIIDRVGKLFY